MLNNVSCIWKYKEMDSKNIITFLKHYFEEEFFVPYKKGTAMGLSDPECKDSFIIEVGDWKRGEWKRNINGSHIAFKFWNHGGCKSIEKKDKLVKMIYRPEDRKQKHDDRFYICKRNKDIENGVLFDRGVELGSYYPKEFTAFTEYEITLKHPPCGYCGKTVKRLYLVKGTFVTISGNPGIDPRIIHDSIKWENRSSYKKKVTKMEDVYDVVLKSYEEPECVRIARVNLDGSPNDEWNE